MQTVYQTLNWVRKIREISYIFFPPPVNNFLDFFVIHITSSAYFQKKKIFQEID